MNNLLDLREKQAPEVVVVEKIILKKRSLIGEVLRAVAIIAIASVSVWGISKADNLTGLINTVPSTKSFSAIGDVSNVTDTNLSITNANGSDGQKDTTYSFDTSAITKIETKDYVPLVLTDIKVGDKVIVQGTTDGINISAKRVISFSAISSNSVIADTASSTASSTLEVSTSTASTTPDNGTSTVATSSATSTSGIVQTVVDAISGTIQNVINAITGTSTGTTTPDLSGATSTPPDATSTPVVDTPPPPTPDPVVTPTPDVPPVVDSPPAN